MESRRTTNILAAALILSFLVLLIIRVWAADREASVTGPAAVKTGADGTVYTLSANVLYMNDRDGNMTGRIPLEKLGVEEFAGDFWIFQNGDLLVWRGQRQQPTIASRLKTFFRIASRSDAVGGREGSLQRCNLSTLQCGQFGNGSGAFRKPLFKIAVDEEKGNVYIADTAANRLLLYDTQGNMKKASAPSFKSPNGMALAPDGLLYVADTDNHRLCGVGTGPENFGTIEKEFAIDEQGAGGRRYYPLSIARSDDGQWWVASSDAGMRTGDVTVYDSNGVFMKRIDLPGDADSLALASAGDHVLAADPVQMRIYRIGRNGTMIGDFGSLLTRIEFQEPGRARASYSVLKHTSLAIILDLGVCTIFVAVKARREQVAGASQAGYVAKGRARGRSSTAVQDIDEGTRPFTDGGRDFEIHDHEEQPRELILAFRGSARDYFRIWIVNLSLTIATLGIYSAWAKVRKKRYFYSHTTLDGTPFQYLGQPVPILKGRIIAAAAFSLYYCATHLFTSLLPYVLLLGLIVAPWVIIRSAAFNARYSAFRNMTFQFKGTYLSALKTIYVGGLLPLIVAGSIFNWWGKPALAALPFLIFGVTFPWWMSRFKNFIVRHTVYGGKEGTFSATGGQFFKIYWRAGLITLGIGLLSGGLVAVLAVFVSKKPQVLMPLFLLPFYAGYVLAYGYIQAQSGNLVWNSTMLGPVRFQSTLLGRGLAKLYVTNALGIIVSLGLLIPWAVIRTLKYRADNLRIVRDRDLADFTGSETGVVQAAGAETMDFFDMDLSL